MQEVAKHKRSVKIGVTESNFLQLLQIVNGKKINFHQPELALGVYIRYVIICVDSGSLACSLDFLGLKYFVHRKSCTSICRDL